MKRGCVNSLKSAFYSRGNACFNIQDYDQAIKDYSKAIDLKPDFAEAFNNRGSAYAGKRMFANAAEDYSRAIDLDSKDPDFYENRSKVYLELGKNSRAESDRRILGTLVP